jgi:hypothetical protein
MNKAHAIIDGGKVLHYHFNNQRTFGENNLTIFDFSGTSNIGNNARNSAIWNRSGGKTLDGAFEFDGFNDKIVVPDDDTLSPSNTGEFTVAFWVKFKRTSFVGEGKNKDYISFLGKGSEDNHEFVFRYYNSSNKEGRNNRISFYMFNPDGGLGSGSYVQEPIKINEWMFLTGVYNGTHVRLYKNGVLKDTDVLTDYDIVSRNGIAPLTIGTVSEKKYFRGSFDELRVYDRALTSEEIMTLYRLRDFYV